MFQLGETLSALEAGKMILYPDSFEMLEAYAGEIHPRLKTLLSHHTRPLTVIYENVEGLPKEVLAADGSCGIRITTDPYCKALIGSFGKPIISTSANKKGEPFPSHFGAISSEVIRAVDHVVRYRQREKSDAQPSIVARWTKQNEIEPIRE